jgi:hypothetical protein
MKTEIKISIVILHGQHEFQGKGRENRKKKKYRTNHATIDHTRHSKMKRTRRCFKWYGRRDILTVMGVSCATWRAQVPPTYWWVHDTFHMITRATHTLAIFFIYIFDRRSNYPLDDLIIIIIIIIINPCANFYFF